MVGLYSKKTSKIVPIVIFTFPNPLDCIVHIMKATVIALLSATTALAVPSDVRFGKRVFDGDSKFVFECSAQTIPGMCPVKIESTLGS